MLLSIKDKFHRFFLSKSLKNKKIQDTSLGSVRDEVLSVAKILQNEDSENGPIHHKRKEGKTVARILHSQWNDDLFSNNICHNKLHFMNLLF